MESRDKAMVVEVSRRLHARGWVANHEGNVSVRVGPERIWATPTAVSKGAVTEEMLVLIDLEGRRVAGRLRPFGEVNLHLACYRTREDVRAVVHAHPPTATGFACAGVDLPVAMMPEATVSLGPEIPTAPYALPGPEAAEQVAQLVARYDAFLLGSHGALTVGVDLEQAYLRMELIEHYARIAKVALELGGPRALPAADVEKLLDARRKAGLGPKSAPPPAPATAPGQRAAMEGARAQVLASADPDLARIMAQEIRRALEGS
jgi:L-fuculose-phosphate aldolase